MSTAALSRNPSRTIQGLKAAMGLGNFVWRLIRTSVKTNRDMRMLQTLPDHVLADMGLQKMEFMTGAGGDRHVWVTPHRYY